MKPNASRVESELLLLNIEVYFIRRVRITDIKYNGLMRAIFQYFFDMKISEMKLSVADTPSEVVTEHSPY